ncbi:hypothetical protein POX_h09653 [Penicillium oxalicum]|uniref:hypothetical protein n=1 Tax=Penicillium oxalicum TaxID=69781 RepID=UPI0020B731A4|nr:hypothetical protein POX_h09653 [Penicillium oxalicum]KAI2785891.1 hypothetical protein POX_h09653 [Penicillium oxalicum]
MRLAAYAGASVALATGVFLKALHQRANFYSACVYLSQSSANVMPPIHGSHGRLAISLLVAVFFNAFMLRYCIRVVIDEARADMMIMFGFEFAILTILSTSTLCRYFISLAELFITQQQIKAKMEERRAEIRATRQEMIREHARAGASSPPTDLPSEDDVNELEIDVPGWEDKGRWVFYLDLVTDFLKLVVYLGFFGILLRFFGLPIHILRDVVVTMRSFARRITDFIRYRNATRDMNERYPDATPAEVAREDVCIICREDMISVLPATGAEGETAEPAANAQRVPDRLRPKKLPCGHVLHFACLRSWLERQQNCPTCRRPVLAAQRNQGATAGTNNQAGNGGNGAQPNGLGNPAPGQPGAQGNLPQARVYQLGPFRVGFGAVRGDLFHNLHQQIHQGAAPLQPPGNVNPPPGARQVGFGFGFGRRPAPPTPVQNPPTFTAGSSNSVSGQLQQIEQELSQAIASLRASAEHLQHVSQLQAELDRVCRQIANSTVPAPTPTTTTSTNVQSGIPGTPAHQFMSDAGAVPMNAGDPRLPEGLTLPPGWTLLPLRSTVPGSAAANQDVAPTPSTSNPPQSNMSNEVPQGLNAEASGSSNPLRSAEISQGSADSAEDGSAPAPSTSAIPNWSMSSASTSTKHGADSPSMEWTDVQSESVQDPGSSAIPTTWGSGGRSGTGEINPGFESATTESSSKGKGRAATGEETVEEDMS